MKSGVLKLVAIWHFLSLVLGVFASHCEACLVYYYVTNSLLSLLPLAQINCSIPSWWGGDSVLSHLGLCRLAQRVCDFIQVWFLRLQDH